MTEERLTRREIIKKAAYVTPAILTMSANFSFASAGSGNYAAGEGSIDYIETNRDKEKSSPTVSDSNEDKDKLGANIDTKDQSETRGNTETKEENDVSPEQSVTNEDTIRKGKKKDKKQKKQKKENSKKAKKEKKEKKSKKAKKNKGLKAAISNLIGKFI